MELPLADALKFTGAYFAGKSPIHEAARRLSTTLDELNIAHVMVGALAVNAHGHRRTSNDVDVLLTREGLAAFKARWLGSGWVERFPGSKGVRDAWHDVPIDVILTGDYPGDGKPKPVVFPDPASVRVPTDAGFPVLQLPVLIELKLASGMTAIDRPRDFDDVIQLIRANDLARDFENELDPYVHERYHYYWTAAQHRDEE